MRMGDWSIRARDLLIKNAIKIFLEVGYVDDLRYLTRLLTAQGWHEVGEGKWVPRVQGGVGGTRQGSRRVRLGQDQHANNDDVQLPGAGHPAHGGNQG